MNTKYFGDSYDLVKRVFIQVLKSEGYTVHVDPMFTDENAAMERDFYLLIGAERTLAKSPRSELTALFVDPDIGIGKKATKKHVTVQNLANRLESYALIMVFDQSFQRGHESEGMQEKLSDFSGQGVSGFFFNSHAKFFFGSLRREPVEKCISALLRLGIPNSRFLRNYAT